MNGGPGGQPSTFGANSSFGASSNSSFGQNQPATGTPQAGTDPSQAGITDISGRHGGRTNPTGPGSGTPGSNQTGIRAKSSAGRSWELPASVHQRFDYREFNHKKKYKDWAFVYDPAQDRGRLITTPYQPQLQGFGQGTQRQRAEWQQQSAWRWLRQQQRVWLVFLGIREQFEHAVEWRIRAAESAEQSSAAAIGVQADSPCRARRTAEGGCPHIKTSPHHSRIKIEPASSLTMRPV